MKLYPTQKTNKKKFFSSSTKTERHRGEGTRGTSLTLGDDTKQIKKRRLLQSKM